MVLSPVKGTLSFENVGSVDVEYAVEAIGAKVAGRMDYIAAPFDCRPDPLTSRSTGRLARVLAGPAAR